MKKNLKEILQKSKSPKQEFMQRKNYSSLKSKSPIFKTKSITPSKISQQKSRISNDSLKKIQTQQKNLIRNKYNRVSTNERKPIKTSVPKPEPYPQKFKSDKERLLKRKNEILKNLNKNKSPQKIKTPSVKSVKKSKQSISPRMINNRLHQRSLIAQNSFKLNLQDLINTDEIYNLIIKTKLQKNQGFNFKLLKQYLVSNFCFILKDLNVLFYNLEFRDKMRKFYLKEILFFCYLLMLLIQTQMEAALLNSYQGEQQFENVNTEIYDLLTQIISNLHIVYVLRVEVFLDRAAVYYQNHSLFKKLKMIMSKRKSNYNIRLNKSENFDHHLVQIQKYLDLTEQTVEELFKLNKNFLIFKNSLKEKLDLIDIRKGELKLTEFSQLLDFLKIEFNSKGIVNFDDKYLTGLIIQSQEEKIVQKQDFPFINSQRTLPYTLIIDLDETLIYYPEDHLDNFQKIFHEKISIRPYAIEFIQRCAKYFEIIIFTAATQEYADPLIDIIDPDRLVSHRFYRQHLTEHDKIMIKDLSKIGRDIKTVIILDNVPQNFILQEENGIFIKSWMGDKKDQIFKILCPVFESIGQSGVKDVREILSELRGLLNQLIF